MALARPPQAPGGTGGLKVAAIALAVVAVAALAFTVVMFTQQSDLQANMERAVGDAEARQREAAQAKADLAAAGKEVIGKEAESLAEIKEAVDRLRKTVADNPDAKKANIAADASLSQLLEQVFALMTSKAGEAAELKAKQEEINKELQGTLAKAQARSDQFDKEVADLTKKYEELTAQSEQFRKETNAKVQELLDTRTKEREDAARDLDTARKAKDEAEAALKSEKKRAEELQAQLAQFKPSETGSLLQIKDGTIVRTVPDNEVAYISLGRRDGVKPGMTFSVYSSARGVPADGKGKAAIEVTNAFETTSECRVTMRTPGEPILPNDVIANPVFDKGRQYHFAVTGDFDLNFDGRIEDPGGRQVIRIIERLGGKVVDRVDSNTDFVVLGAPPPPPRTKSGTEDDAAAAERAAQAKQVLQAFEDTVKEAKSLSIPILTRTQFLHFLGYVMPSNTADDSLPTL